MCASIDAEAGISLFKKKKPRSSLKINYKPLITDRITLF
jgi:hypothetical protein